MKKYILATIVLLFGFSLLTGCHNTGRQLRKTSDGIHDLLLEGSN